MTQWWQWALALGLGALLGLALTALLALWALSESSV